MSGQVVVAPATPAFRQVMRRPDQAGLYHGALKALLRHGCWLSSHHSACPRRAFARNLHTGNMRLVLCSCSPLLHRAETGREGWFPPSFCKTVNPSANKSGTRALPCAAWLKGHDRPLTEAQLV